MNTRQLKIVLNFGISGAPHPLQPPITPMLNPIGTPMTATTTNTGSEHGSTGTDNVCNSRVKIRILDTEVPIIACSSPGWNRIKLNLTLNPLGYKLCRIKSKKATNSSQWKRVMLAALQDYFSANEAWKRLKAVSGFEKREGDAVSTH